MANRTIGDFTRSRLVVPDLAPDMSGANLMNMVSKQAGHAADVAIQEWQQAEVSAATVEGTVAGRETDVAYRPAGTLTADAFNQAAQKSYAAGIQMRTTSEMMRLKETNPANPSGYLNDSEEFISGITDEVRRNGGEELARQVEGKLKLEQQTQGYKVAKERRAIAAQEHKGYVAARTQQLKTNAYISAGEIFSKDENIKNAAMNTFLDAQVELRENLHAVVDGKPLYTGEAIQKREQAFQSEFFQKAVQNYVAGNDVPPDDLKAILDGSFKLEFPEVGELRVVDFVGTDKYKTKVIDFTMSKMKEKEAVKEKKKALDKEERGIARDGKDIEVLAGIYAGQITSPTSIQQMVANGEISDSVGKSALKMLYNPQPSIDNKAYIAELKVRQINGEDIIGEVKRNMTQIGPKAFEQFIVTGAEMGKAEQAEDEKWIVKEMTKKDEYGGDDPRYTRFAADAVDTYRTKIEGGMEPELAFQEVRNVIDQVKSREKRRVFSNVPKYAAVTGGKMNWLETMNDTIKALDQGMISKEKAAFELERIEAYMEDEANRGGAKNE